MRKQIWILSENSHSQYLLVYSFRIFRNSIYSLISRPKIYLYFLYTSFYQFFSIRNWGISQQTPSDATRSKLIRSVQAFSGKFILVQHLSFVLLKYSHSHPRNQESLLMWIFSSVELSSMWHPRNRWELS